MNNNTLKFTKRSKIGTWKGTISTWLNKNILFKVGAVLCSTIKSTRSRPNIIYSYNDYIRLSSLELVSHEIYNNNIDGNIAELGVFQGSFAKYINLLFPDRKLYLFDTFEGFANYDIETEKTVNSITTIDDFSKTSVEMVLNKMQYKENCIVKKGFFPKTAQNLEDSFAFVSIDADLYEPIYNGLTYFYPRLTKGGYIFVHDFGNTEGYKGASMAVKQYCAENNIPYFPLSDTMGSAVICK